MGRLISMRAVDLTNDNDSWMRAIENSECIIRYQGQVVKQIVDMGTYFSLRFAKGESHLPKSKSGHRFFDIEWLTPQPLDSAETMAARNKREGAEMYNELGFWIEFLGRLQNLALEMVNAGQDGKSIDATIKHLMETKDQDDYVLELHDHSQPIKARLRLVWEFIDYMDGVESNLDYDYRRCIELVQVLASEKQYKGLQILCKAWGVKEQLDPPSEVNPLEMVARLAKAAIEYDRK